jgi:hypothetical protein
MRLFCSHPYSTLGILALDTSGLGHERHEFAAASQAILGC